MAFDKFRVHGNRDLADITIRPRVGEKKSGHLNQPVERFGEVGNSSNVRFDPIGQAGQLLSKTSCDAATGGKMFLLSGKE